MIMITMLMIVTVATITTTKTTMQTASTTKAMTPIMKTTIGQMLMAMTVTMTLLNLQFAVLEPPAVKSAAFSLFRPAACSLAGNSLHRAVPAGCRLAGSMLRRLSRLDKWCGLRRPWHTGMRDAADL